MEQVVFDINHLQPPQAHLDLTGTQSPFVVSSGLHSSVGLESNSSLSKSPIHCIFSSLCHDSLGWGPVDKNFVFTPCFINGAIANIPNLIALVFGSYQLYSLSKKKPHSIPIDWHLFVKLVCYCFIFFFSFFFRIFQLTWNIIIGFGLGANYFLYCFLYIHRYFQLEISFRHCILVSSSLGFVFVYSWFFALH